MKHLIAEVEVKKAGIKCTLCGWTLSRPCVSADGEYHNPNGCENVVTRDGIVGRIVPMISDESDGIGGFEFEPIIAAA